MTLSCALTLLAGALAEGLFLGLLLWRRPPNLLVGNYRGITVLGSAGATLALPIVVAAEVAWRRQWAPLMGPTALRGVALSACIFLVLGLLDDLYGSGEVRGLKGHLTALLKRRRVTTGLLKAVGGIAAALLAAWALGVRDWTILPAGAVVALAANATNALDARPGRAMKAFIVAAALLIGVSALLAPTEATVVLLGLLGAALVLAPFDLRERVMLGDAGANPLGCALGMTMVGITPWPCWVLIAALLLGFCLAADRWSLSSVIQTTPLLRSIDAWGTVRSRAAGEDDGD